MKSIVNLIAARSSCLAAVFGAVLSFAPSAFAHDPHEITADVHFVEDRLEVMITQMHLTALAACSMDTASRRNFSTRQFDEVKAGLEKCARSAVVIKSTKGRLEPIRVAATMNKEGEIEFRLVFPRPSSGTVFNLDAAMLRTLVDPAYVFEATVVIDGKFRSQHALLIDQSAIEFTLPSDDEAPPSPAKN